VSAIQSPRRPWGFALVAALSVAGCADDATGEGGTQPRIARLQLSVANQIVSIDGNGQVTNGPIVLRAGIDVEVHATFLTQSGLPDPLVTAAAYQLNLIPNGGTAVITFALSDIDPFDGIIRCNFANTSGTILLSLHNFEEQKDYWGPFEASVIVIP
jgi:hypothetical protein